MTISQNRSKFNLSASDLSNYAQNVYSYPAELYGQPEAFNNGWMMININVQDKANNGVTGQFELTGNAKSRRLPYGLSETPIDQKTPYAVAAGVAAVTAGAMAFKNHIKDGKSFAGNVSKTAVAGLGAGALAAAPFAAVNLLGTRSVKRIKDQIVFPMPNSLSTNYSMDWEQSNTALFDMMARMANVPAKALSMLAGGGGDKTSMASIGSAGADGVSQFILSTASLAGAGSVSAATGMAANPKKEMVFNSVNFRSFTLDYRFYPKSAKELETLYDIIYLLKYHMHPSFLNGATKMTYVYPSEFDITFFAKGTNENTYVNKIATCVLENMIVNNTPDGAWVAHENGAPNGVTIQLQFKELAILTKESIEIGY